MPLLSRSPSSPISEKFERIQLGQAEVTFDYSLKVAVDRNEAVRKVAGQRVQDDVDVAADVELRIGAKKVFGCPASSPSSR